MLPFLALVVVTEAVKFHKSKILHKRKRDFIAKRQGKPAIVYLDVPPTLVQKTKKNKKQKKIIKYPNNLSARSLSKVF